MKSTIKKRFTQFGPRPISIVPISRFEKLSSKYLNGKNPNEMLEELWEIIGPSAELNLKRLPLWKVIAMAYFEGCIHTNQMLNEERRET